MGRKDATRFKKIEDRLKTLEEDQEKMLVVEEKIVRDWKYSLVLLRDIFNKLIEGN